MNGGDLPDTQGTAEPLTWFSNLDPEIEQYRGDVQAIVDDALAKLKEYQVTFGELLGEGLNAMKRVRAGKGPDGGLRYEDVPDHTSRRAYMETWRGMYKDCMNVVIELTKAAGVKVDNANILVTIPETIRDRVRSQEACGAEGG